MLPNFNFIHCKSLRLISKIKDSSGSEVKLIASPTKIGKNYYINVGRNLSIYKEAAEGGHSSNA